MAPDLPERALDVARADLDGCGFPAFTSVALTAQGPVLPPCAFLALRPAVASAVRLREDDAQAAIFVIGCDRRGEETHWTVYDERGERRVLTRREVPEAPMQTLLDVL